MSGYGRFESLGKESFVNRISAATRISLGLTCAVVSVLFIARSLGLVPDTDAAVLAGRKSLGEAVAMECCLAARA